MGLQEALAEVMAKYGGGLGGPAPAAPAWGAAPAAQGLPPILGISVPIKIQTPNGSMRCYISLPAELGQNPPALMAALEALANAGFPLDIWQPRARWGGGGGGGGNGGGRPWGGRSW